MSRLEPEQPWLERAAMLLQQSGEETAALRPLLRSARCGGRARPGRPNFRSSVIVDGKARQYLQEEQSLLAADLIFSEGHDTTGALVMALRGLRVSEQADRDGRIALVERQQWVTIALVAGLWLVGLMALVPLPRSAIQDSGIAGLGFDRESRVPNPECRASRRACLACSNRSRGGRRCLRRAARTADTASLRDVTRARRRGARCARHHRLDGRR